MRFCLQMTSVVLVAISLTALPGCGSQTPATKPSNEPAASHYEGDGHDHSKDDADHSGHGKMTKASRKHTCSTFLTYAADKTDRCGMPAHLASSPQVVAMSACFRSGSGADCVIGMRPLALKHSRAR